MESPSCSAGLAENAPAGRLQECVSAGGDEHVDGFLEQPFVADFPKVVTAQDGLEPERVPEPDNNAWHGQEFVLVHEKHDDCIQSDTERVQMKMADLESSNMRLDETTQRLQRKLSIQNRLIKELKDKQQELKADDKPELRFAMDGYLYSKAEFLEYYGQVAGLDVWGESAFRSLHMCITRLVAIQLQALNLGVELGDPDAASSAVGSVLAGKIMSQIESIKEHLKTAGPNEGIT